MQDGYTVIGSELSPYSVKVRAFMRYKGVPHRWIVRREADAETFNRRARLPIVPTVVTPEDEWLQDSTPIMEALDALYPKPGVHPPSTALAFLSVMIEEFGDEWGNKVMFHSRWWHEVDQLAAAQTASRLRDPYAGADQVAAWSREQIERQHGRRDFVGSNAQTAVLLERYFIELVDILEAHLTDRKYLFGGRPSLGDFGLAAELLMAAQDPTCSSFLRSRGTHVLDWVFRMNEPHDDGPFEDWAALAPTLAPLIAYIGRYFLPWSTANARALEAGETRFTVMLAAEPYTQPPQRYHAKSLKALKEKYRAVAGDRDLRDILNSSGCLAYLE